MSTIRQDAWSGDDDLILAEVVLRHIREGSTQLVAFEEVGERLSRTSAACGFRWNSTIRKKYESAIALAKKQRTMVKKTKDNHYSTDVSVSDWNEECSDEPIPFVKKVQSDQTEMKKKVETLTMEKVLSFLTDYHENSKNELTPLEIEELKSENERLKEKIEAERKKNQVIAEDYKSLVLIMDRARKMSLQDQTSGL